MESTSRFRLFGFEAVSGIRHDVLGAPVERGNAILMRAVPLDGEPTLDALAIGQESWCRSGTEDVSKQSEAKRRKQKTPTADRFVVERVA